MVQVHTGSENRRDPYVRTLSDFKIGCPNGNATFDVNTGDVFRCNISATARANQPWNISQVLMSHGWLSMNDVVFVVQDIRVPQHT